MKTNDFLEKPRTHSACCQASSLKDSGCSISLVGLTGEWICLSGTLFQKHHRHTQKLSDFILFQVDPGGAWRGYPIELKSGNARVSDVVEQLQQGANIIDQLSAGGTVVIKPILVHKHLSALHIRELRRSRVVFRGKKIMISLVKCGGQLIDAK